MTTWLTIFLNVLLLFRISSAEDSPDTADNSTLPVHLTTEEVLAKHNYPVRKYEVQTADNYTIDLYNIPRGPKTKKTKNRVILLLPGLYSQSYFYFFFPSESLGTICITISNIGKVIDSQLQTALKKTQLSANFLQMESFGIYPEPWEHPARCFTLPDMGYDTWTTNFRGQSDQELNLHPDRLGPKGNGWDFSIDEIAKYDVPALIDAVLKKTGASKLTLVGHSMGNTAAFMTLCERPDYNKKVDLLIALGPAIYVTPNSGAGWFVAQYPLIRMLYLAANAKTGFEQLQVSGNGVRIPGSIVCPPNGRILPICRFFSDAIMGSDPNIPANILPSIISHTSSASFRTHYQYIQHTDTGRFAHYDFGPKENVKRYGIPISPIYDLRRITTPVAIISGWDDKFNNIYNIRYMMRNIPKVVKNHVVPHYKFNHMSFVAARDLGEAVNSHIYELLKRNYKPANFEERLRTRLLSPPPDGLIPTIARKLQFQVEQAINHVYDWGGLSEDKPKKDQ